MLPQQPETTCRPPSLQELRVSTIVLGKLLGLTDEAFYKVFGLTTEIISVVSQSVLYKEVSDKLFFSLADSPEKTLAKAESLAIRKLISLIDCGDKKLEYQAATETLNRLRGKPINTTHLVATQVSNTSDPVELQNELKASQKRLDELLDKRAKLSGNPNKPLTLEAELVT